MKLRILLAFIISIPTACFTYSQEVVIKNGKISIDGKDVLKYETEYVFQQSLYSLDGDEILMLKINNNLTVNDTSDDYLVMNFLNEKVKVETQQTDQITAGIGLSEQKNMQKTIKWLLKEKVLDSNGKINSKKLEIFHDKYDENITNRTQRIIYKIEGKKILE